MHRLWMTACVLALFAGGLAASGASAQTAPAQAKQAARKPAIAGPAIEIEPKAVAILKAASDRLAGAKTMSFTAYVSEESPSRLGPALMYTSRYDVALQRPDKLRVTSPGDGVATDLFYDGRTLSAHTPASNLLATAPAPATIDAMLQQAYTTADIYFPFTDLIVADPYKAIADGLRFAFYVGQSKTVGGTTTDIVAYGNKDVFVQVWVGAEDRLPRKMRAIYAADRLKLRHEMTLEGWTLDVAIPAEQLALSAAAKAASPITFGKPSAEAAKARAKAMPRPLAQK